MICADALRAAKGFGEAGWAPVWACASAGLAVSCARAATGVPTTTAAQSAVAIRYVRLWKTRRMGIQAEVRTEANPTVRQRRGQQCYGVSDATVRNITGRT